MRCEIRMVDFNIARACDVENQVLCLQPSPSLSEGLNVKMNLLDDPCVINVQSEVVNSSSISLVNGSECPFMPNIG